MDWHNGNPDIIHDAHLARAAYSGAKEVHGWEMDMELSNENRAVYHKGGKAKVAFRGTDPSHLLKPHKPREFAKSWRDIGTDVLLGVGLQDVASRHRNALRTTDLAIQKYGKENVSLTGHSLGGSQAMHVSRKRGIKATGFSAAASPVDVLRKRTYSHFHSVSTKYDPISSMTHHKVKRIGKKTTVSQKSSNPHALENYLG